MKNPILVFDFIFVRRPRYLPQLNVISLVALLTVWLTVINVLPPAKFVRRLVYTLIISMLFHCFLLIFDHILTCRAPMILFAAYPFRCILCVLARRLLFTAIARCLMRSEERKPNGVFGDKQPFVCSHCSTTCLSIGR